jgi:hypothetical protein
METLPKIASYASMVMSRSKSAANSLKDRVIRVDVVDANNVPIPGAIVKFFVNGTFAGEQVTANGRATIQVSDKNAKIEIQSLYESKESERVSLADDYWEFTFADVHLDAYAEPDPGTPVGFLKWALRVIPAQTKLVLGGVVIFAAASLVLGWTRDFSFGATDVAPLN